MKKLYINLLLPSLFAISFFGCGSSNDPLSGLDENQYKIVKERLDFEKNQHADMNFEIDLKTNKSLTMLLDGHVKIMYKINLPTQKQKRAKAILYAELVSKKRVLFDKILIQKKDYYFDSVNNAVYVAVEIPFIYLLDNKYGFELNIAYVDRKRKIAQRNITMLYQTKPMQDNGEKFMSFQYADSFDSENVDPFIISMLKQEYKQAYLQHFEKEYLARHAKLLEELKND